MSIEGETVETTGVLPGVRSIDSSASFAQAVVGVVELDWEEKVEGADREESP